MSPFWYGCVRCGRVNVFDGAAHSNGGVRHGSNIHPLEEHMHFSRAARRVRNVALIGLALAGASFLALLTVDEPATKEVALMGLGLGIGWGIGCGVSWLGMTAGAWRDRQASK